MYNLGIKDLLEDLNPQLLTTIQSEFDKVEGQAAPEPTRTSVDLASIPQSSSSGKAGRATDPMDDLFPRVEIDKLLAGTTILADAKSDAWKTRKDALEALQGILDIAANKRLKPTMGKVFRIFHLTSLTPLKAKLDKFSKRVSPIPIRLCSSLRLTSYAE